MQGNSKIAKIIKSKCIRHLMYFKIAMVRTSVFFQKKIVNGQIAHINFSYTLVCFTVRTVIYFILTNLLQKFIQFFLFKWLA